MDALVQPNTILVNFEVNGIFKSNIYLTVGNTTLISSTILSPLVSTSTNTKSHFANSSIYLPRNSKPISKSSIGPNIRKELKYILDRIGFRWAGLRKIDYNQSCPCSRNGSEPSCKRCMKTGYIFTDYLVKVYRWERSLGVLLNAEASRISTMTNDLIIEHNRPINKFDFYLMLDLDPDTGNPRQPFKILKYFEVQNSTPILGDSSRVEYWKCLIEERSIDDGRPGPQGTGVSYKGNRSISGI